MKPINQYYSGSNQKILRFHKLYILILVAFAPHLVYVLSEFQEILDSMYFKLQKGTFNKENQLWGIFAMFLFILFRRILLPPPSNISASTAALFS